VWPLRIDAGTAVDETPAGDGASSDPRHVAVNVKETEELARRTDGAECSGSPILSAEEIFVDALREEARYCAA
jgi:hypothetical protein